MSSGAVDARPFLRASKESLWSKAEASADDFVSTIKDERAKLGINAAVTRSPGAAWSANRTQRLHVTDKAARKTLGGADVRLMPGGFVVDAVYRRARVWS